MKLNDPGKEKKDFELMEKKIFFNFYLSPEVILCDEELMRIAFR